MRDAVLHCRLDRDLYDWAKAAAAAENRTVTNFIETVLREVRAQAEADPAPQQEETRQ